jgi:FxsC-like protein
VPYQYFFSYARKNRNSDLDQFIADLNEQILLREYFPEKEVGFFDGKRLETGTKWEDELATALRTSRVFLALCSPDYINSDYCGKEFQVFLQRYKSYVQQKKPATPPKLILPIIWGAPSGSLRDVISQFQYTDDALPAVYAQEGLAYMMKLKAHADDYATFVNRLAQKIVRASADHPLDDLAQLRGIDRVISAFHDAAASASEDGDRVWFVFVAGKPAELSPPRVSVDRYRKNGGRDWRPFYPTLSESVGLIAQSVAAQYGRYFTELPLAELLDTLDPAESAHEPIVVVVDPWTLRVSGYQTEMKRLDRHIASTCAIVVPWNVPDTETDAERVNLQQLLGQTFATRTKFGKDLHYWGEVDSAVGLKARLLEILAHYTNKTLENTKAEKTIPEAQVLPGGIDLRLSLAQPSLVDNTPSKS